MYLTRLRLENVKLLDDLELSFVRNGAPRLWTVLLGDNGVCKTSILQAIALAASGEKLARALVKDAAEYACATAPSRAVRIAAKFERGQAAATKESEALTETPPLAIPEGPAQVEVEMRVEPGLHDFDGSRDAAWIAALRSRRNPGLFVVAYGVGRYLPRPGEVAVSPDPVHDRVEGIFDSRHKMLGVDFFSALKLRDSQQGAELARAYAGRIRDVLTAVDPTTNERLLPWLDRIELRGKAGVDAMVRLLESHRFELEIGPRRFKLAPHMLSQGYQSITAWISDLLGHAFLEHGRDVDPALLEGVVLLDEIDLHLHPTWQRRLVPILRATFPRLQFIVTTHSPLVLTGFEADEIVRLEMHDDGVVRPHGTVLEPGAQSASQLLTSYFDVPTAKRPELVVDERRFRELEAMEHNNGEQQAELAQLVKKLEPYWKQPLRDPAPAASALEGPLDERVEAMERRVRALTDRGGE